MPATGPDWLKPIDQPLASRDESIYGVRTHSIPPPRTRLHPLPRITRDEAAARKADQVNHRRALDLNDYPR